MPRTSGPAKGASGGAHASMRENGCSAGMISAGLNCGMSAVEAGGEIEEIESLIETEVIPRLLLLHSGAGHSAPALREAGQLRRCTAADVDSLTSLALAMDSAGASHFIESLRQEGVAVEELLMNLLAPVARKLGDMWTKDQADFLQVTSAVCELHRLLHRLAPPGSAPVVQNGPKALLMAAPGEQHSFGLLIVAESFRNAGWEVTTGVPPLLSSIRKVVGEIPYQLVGFSLSCETLIEPLKSAIAEVHERSCLRDTKVMVGGYAFEAHPELHRKVGADLFATDANQAVELARAFVSYD
jgi:methanogenic corrinoid protein MtbC1